MRVFLLLVILFCLKAQAGGFETYQGDNKSNWDSANHPSILVKDYNGHFPSLPLVADLRQERTLWSDSYWPRNEGGISRRWQDLSGTVKYKILSEKEAKKLTPSQISALSPSEKFDLLLDDYSFSFTRKIKRQNPLNRPDWEGICHGWAPATIHHPQFSAATFTNKSGAEIRFASSDVAALISYYHAWVGRGKVRFLGRRCRESSGNTSSKCTDMNAGAFHIVLTNLIPARKSFIVDRDPYRAVWNHPVVGYESRIIEERIPSSRAATGTVREILISTKLSYVNETGPEWNPPVRAEGKQDYWYWLELDSENKIIGGSWSDANHPDFAWITTPPKISAPYSILLQN